MRYATVLMVCLTLLTCACLSRDEVFRTTSPDGRVDALLFEANCGVPCSFGYEVRLVAKGGHDGEKVAYLDGATRNAQAWGVNLKWLAADRLSVEYLHAENARLLRQRVGVGGRDIQIFLRSGMSDPLAPAGGMLYNLNGHPRN